MRPLLEPVVHHEGEMVVVPITQLMTWQKTLIPKKAWAIIADHAAVTGRRYRTKNELARCLIYRVVRTGLRCDYITFDSWYASKEHLNMLTRLGLVYVTTVPCSRKLETARRLRSASDVIDSAKRVDDVAAMFATRDYVPYATARLRALRVEVTLNGLTHPAQLVIITRQDWIGTAFFARLCRRTIPSTNTTIQPRTSTSSRMPVRGQRARLSATTEADGPLNVFFAISNSTSARSLSAPQP